MDDRFIEKDKLDEIPLDWNCYEFAFSKLGLKPEDGKSLGLNDYSDKFFDKVYDIKDADVIVIFHKEKSKYRSSLYHMVYLNENGKLIHKSNSGFPVEETTLDNLKKDFTEDIFEFSYLRLKK